MARLIGIEPVEEKNITHRKCGAKIGYYPIEVQSAIHHDIGGGSDTWYYVICPNCGEKVIVNDPKL